MDGRTAGWTENLPILQDFVPYRAAAQKGLRPRRGKSKAMTTFKSEIETMTWEMTMTDGENRQRHRRRKPQQQQKQETKTETKAPKII